MLNIAYTHASVVLVFFHYYMLQNIQSIVYFTIYLCVICISNKVEYLDKEGSCTTSAKEVVQSF